MRIFIIKYYLWFRSTIHSALHGHRRTKNGRKIMDRWRTISKMAVDKIYGDYNE